MSAGKYLGVLLVGFVLGLGWKTYDYHAKYLQDYAAWETRSRDYQRMYAAWLAQHKQLQEVSK